MKIFRFVFLWFLILVAAAATGCAPVSKSLPRNAVSQSNLPTPTQNVAILPTISANPTTTPTQLPSITPSLTPLPSATPPPTATPLTVTLFPKGPDLIYTGDNTRMKVVWQLSSTAESILEWGNDTQYTLGSVTTAEYDPDHQHTYTITGLTPSARYEYRVVTDAGYSIGSFYAAPSTSAGRLKFFVYGDSREGTDILNQISGQIVSAYTADPAFQTFSLATGDLVEDGDQESYWAEQFFDPKKSAIRSVLANLSFMPVMGNHENSGILLKKYFPMPFAADHYWSFDYGPAHIVMLDQYSPYNAGSTQYNWLTKDLASSNKTWKFLVLHEPGWSAAGGHLNNPDVQTDIQPLAQKYGVSVIFGAHNHYYARAVVNGVTHLTVGGGGAPLYPPVPGQPFVVMTKRSYCFVEIAIDGNTLSGTALQSDGTLIETFTLTR